MHFAPTLKKLRLSFQINGLSFQKLSLSFSSLSTLLIINDLQTDIFTARSAAFLHGSAFVRLGFFSLPPTGLLLLLKKRSSPHLSGSCSPPVTIFSYLCCHEC